MKTTILVDEDKILNHLKDLTNAFAALWKWKKEFKSAFCPVIFYFDYLPGLPVILNHFTVYDHWNPVIKTYDDPTTGVLITVGLKTFNLDLGII